MLRNIEAERARRGWSREKIAQELNISTKTYENWIGEKTDITGRALIKLSKLFKVKIEYLLEGMEDKT